MDVTHGHLTFSSNFDSGNCASVERRGSSDEPHFQLWVTPDCAGTEFETTYRTWFHFSVTGGRKGEMLNFTIMNLNKQNNLYANDMRPVYKSVPSKGNRWERLKYPTSFQATDGSFQLKCKHKFEADGDTVYIAFCYPQSYTELQAWLRRLDTAYLGHNAGRDGVPSVPRRKSSAVLASAAAAAAGAGAEEGADGAAAEAASVPAPDTATVSEAMHAAKLKAGALVDSDIYYHRELAIRSLDGRRVDLLTVTSREGLTNAREDYIEGMFPDGEAWPRAHKFTGKRTIFISSRVHPGETPSAFVFEGILEFVLRKDDPRAVKLRSMFVFKFVPMLNPDGVARGHYRADQRGVNLNRCYMEPNLELEPTIFAAVHLVRYHSANEKAKLWLYLDLHAHATKRGCFLYGNHLPDMVDQVTNVMFARAVTLNTPWLEFGACNFSEKNMSLKDKRDKGVSKEGAGRVALYRQTGLIHCYTLECNYNTGRQVNQIYGTDAERLGASPPRDQRGSVPKYTPEHWRDVGKGVAIAFLDMNGANPWSRLARSEWRTLEGLRQFVERGVKCESPYREQARKMKMAERLAGATGASRRNRIGENAGGGSANGSGGGSSGGGVGGSRRKVPSISASGRMGTSRGSNRDMSMTPIVTSDGGDGGHAGGGDAGGVKTVTAGSAGAPSGRNGLARLQRSRRSNLAGGASSGGAAASTAATSGGGGYVGVEPAGGSVRPPVYRLAPGVDHPDAPPVRTSSVTVADAYAADAAATEWVASGGASATVRDPRGGRGSGPRGAGGRSSRAPGVAVPAAPSVPAYVHLDTRVVQAEAAVAAGAPLGVRSISSSMAAAAGSTGSVTYVAAGSSSSVLTTAGGSSVRAVSEHQVAHFRALQAQAAGSSRIPVYRPGRAGSTKTVLSTRPAGPSGKSPRRTTPRRSDGSGVGGGAAGSLRMSGARTMAAGAAPALGGLDTGAAQRSYHTSKSSNRSPLKSPHQPAGPPQPPAHGMGVRATVRDAFANQNLAYAGE